MTAFACPARPLAAACFLAFACIDLVAAASRPALAADPDAGDLRPAGWSPFVSIRRDSLKLPERTATLVVGNPLIADAVVQPGGVVVITAKSYGATNLVALDRTGATLSDHPIQVVGPADKVGRGLSRHRAGDL